MAANFPLRVAALRVHQPMGEYFVVILPAEVLLEVAYSDRLSARMSADAETYELEGTQRLLQPKRLNAIADYINRADAAFPNTIILAANFRRDNGLIEGEDPDDDSPEDGEAKRWTIESEGAHHWLTIPTREKLAAVIDGQHRLFAFAEAREYRYGMQMICSVFLDLPKPYQAQLFARYFILTYGVRALSSDQKEGVTLPYEIEVEAMAFFRYVGGDEFVGANRFRAVRFSGYQILYGAIREMVCNLTARGRHGMMHLPARNFGVAAQTRAEEDEKERIALIAGRSKNTKKVARKRTTRLPTPGPKPQVKN